MKKIVLFDFDGVLLNTHLITYDIHKELNPSLDYGFFKSLSDGNFWELFQKAEREGKIIDNPKFGDKYENHLAQADIVPALKNLIIDLAAMHDLYIVSSTSASWISKFLKKENILDKFQKILGAEAHKSKVVKIDSLIKERNITPNNFIFITDTTGDIIEGRACRVESIGITWGMHSREELSKEKPYAVVDTPEELEVTIREFLK